MRTTGPVACLLAVLVTAAPLLAQGPVEPVRTSFDPSVDGMPFVDLGDEGDSARSERSFGMSLVAVDNYLRRMRGRAEGRPDPKPIPITRSAQEGSGEAKVLASLVQAVATAQDDHGDGPPPTAKPNDPKLLREAIERMRETGEPQLLGTWARKGPSHTAVLFGYEAGDLLVYDPTFPGETIRWPWDPARGLGAHPRRDDDSTTYGPQKKYDAAPFGAHRTSRELQALRDACVEGVDRCLARSHDLRARLEGTTEAPFVAGNVGSPGGRGHRPAGPRRVYVVVNGTPVAAGSVRSDGGFRFQLGSPVPPGARVQFVATTPDGALAGANDLDPANNTTRGIAGNVRR